MKQIPIHTIAFGDRLAEGAHEVDCPQLGRPVSVCAVTAGPSSIILKLLASPASVDYNLRLVGCDAFQCAAEVFYAQSIQHAIGVCDL